MTDILTRFLDHWFAPTAKKWPWYRRFFYTLTGSATFFFAWLVHVIGTTGVVQSPDHFDVFIMLAVPIIVFGTFWFAGITAWKDLSYGPVRLYLSGFLLPYLVWSLIVFMLGRILPKFPL